MDAEDELPSTKEGIKSSPRNLLSLHYIVIICIISVIAYPFLTPSFLSGILPLLCLLSALVYPYSPRGVEKDYYKRITIGFIFSVSLLMLIHLASGKLTTRASEDLFILLFSGLIALVGLVILVDIFITFEKMNPKFWLRLIPAMLYISIAALFVTIDDGTLEGTYRTIAPYITFSVVLASGILLAIYSWIEIERKRMNWFYIYCSFVSVVAFPVVMIIITKLITQPVLVSSSCHATYVISRRKNFLGRYLEKRRRTQHLRRLKENGSISKDFYSVMSGLITEKNRK